MANPWFRMYSEFATDPKVQMMSEEYQRRYIMLLCLRCSNDDVTLHVTEVAFQLRIANSEWEETRAIFLEKGLITEDNKPTAWNKRQYVSDSSVERVRKHREKQKKDVKRPCNVTVTPPDTDSDTDSEETYTPNFNEIWKRYPNKDGKKQAERHFLASVKTEKDFISINTALDKYLAHLKTEDWKKPKNGSTWFNNWQDWLEWEEPKSQTSDPYDKDIYK